MTSLWLCRWWLSTNIGGGSTGYLSREELEALPAELQPLMREYPFPRWSPSTKIMQESQADAARYH